MLILSIPREKETTVAPLEFNRLSGTIRAARRLGVSEVVQMMNTTNPMFFAKYIDVLHRLKDANQIK